MNSQYDVAIIGGGAIGVCSAYYLAQKGAKVLLIEKGEIASGCSYGNGGLIVPSHAVPLASPGALGNGLRWLLDSASPFYLKPRLDMDLLKWLTRFVVASRHEQMMLSLTVMSAADVCNLEPALLPGVVGGVYYPRDAHINPFRFVTGLAEKAREFGAEISTGTEVLALETKNGSVIAIKTTRGDIHPQKVVLAAGSWSPEIARAFRLNIPIQAAKGYSITFEKPAISPKIPLLFE